MRALKPRSILPGKANDPYAVRTTLGWGVVGAKDHEEDTELTGERAGCHRIATEEIAGGEQTTCKFTSMKNCKEVMTPSSIKRMFEQDISETHDTKQAMSQEDLKFMKITSSRIHKADKHYQFSLPLRKENIWLPNNRNLAEAKI